MVTSVGIKVPKKKARLAPRVQRGSKIIEPSWDGVETWTGEQFHRTRRFASDFYYEHFKQSDMAADVYLWMKNNGYSASDIKSAKAAPNSRLSVITSINARMINRGMPDTHLAWNIFWEGLGGTYGTPRPTSEYLKERVQELINAGALLVEKEVQVSTNSPVVVIAKPTIQDYLREKNSEAMGELEGRVDDFVNKEFKGDPKAIELLTTSNIGIAQLKAFVEFIEKKITFYEVVLEGKDSQLVEGYNHWNKRQLKAVVAWWTQALADVNSYANIKKVSKAPRKKKTVSPDKIVSKLKYLKEFAELGLKSVEPTSILECSELWVYNIKTRKIGIYITDSYQPTLTVKGSAILGFSAAESVQKTLRKPKDQIKEFAKNGKPAAKKWFKGIKSTEIKLNGRMNADIILLKAYK